MATLTKTPKTSPEGALIPVDQDPDVLAAAEIARTFEERDQALRSERRALDLAANPNTFGSADHRVPLTEPERIAAHDRLQAIAAELRQLRVDRPAAEERLRVARAAAYDRAEPVAREQLLPSSHGSGIISSRRPRPRPRSSRPSGSTARSDGHASSS